MFVCFLKNPFCNFLSFFVHDFEKITWTQAVANAVWYRQRIKTTQFLWVISMIRKKICTRVSRFWTLHEDCDRCIQYLVFLQFFTDNTTLWSLKRKGTVDCFWFFQNPNSSFPHRRCKCIEHSDPRFCGVPGAAFEPNRLFLLIFHFEFLRI